MQLIYTEILSENDIYWRQKALDELLTFVIAELTSYEIFNKEHTSFQVQFLLLEKGIMYGGPERTWCKYILSRYSDLASRYSDLASRYSDLTKSL